MIDPSLHWSNIHTIIFDFDGVFTDNKVWVNQDGVESVKCDRGDGLGFDILRNFIMLKHWHLDYFILSKETNPVVSSRARKMSIPCIQSMANKAHFVSSYLSDNNKSSEGLLFVGNDLNDLASIQLAGFSVAPSDAHPIILDQVDLVLNQKGGEGFVRALIEKLIGIHKMKDDELLNLL